MRRIVVLVLALACGGSTEPTQQQQQKKAAIDPAIRIHVVNQLDPATDMGRASWNVFALIYSADPNQAGVAFWSTPNQSGNLCGGFSADSIGQRAVIVLAVADLQHPTSYTAARDIANAWYAGNRSVPNGWAALASDSVDWGVSTQFDQGHGQTATDPIRWRVTWTSPATVARVEAANDTSCP